MNTGPSKRHGRKLTDTELDAVLAAADADLLDHARATADPAAFLLTLMDSPLPTRTDRPNKAPSTDAATLINMRRDTLRIARDLGRLREVTDALGDALRARDLDLADGLGRDLGVALRAHELITGIARRARDLDLTRAFDVVLDLARAFTDAFVVGNDLVRAIEHVHNLAHALNLTRELTDALTRTNLYARDLENVLDDAEIDASGADLSELGPADMDTIAGVVWDERTTWPPDIAQQVRDRSTQIRPGLYRVSGGSEREDTDMITV